jgi:hypothetical protein
MRPLLVAAAFGVGLALVTLALVLGAGRAIGHEAGIPWSCDDTRYVDTVPTGRGVVGPAVSAPPGCGGQRG